MAKKRTVDQILNETLPGPSKDIYKKKWDEFKVFFGVPQPQWLRMQELPHNNYKGRSGGKASQPHKSTSTSQSPALRPWHQFLILRKLPQQTTLQ